VADGNSSRQRDQSLRVIAVSFIYASHGALHRVRRPREVGVTHPPRSSQSDARFVVQQNEPSLRLDRFLVARVPGWSRRRSAQSIAAGAIRVNGHRARKGQLLRPGDVVAIIATVLGEQTLAPSTLELRVLHEDDALIVVDKPAGVPSVARGPDDRDTLANALVTRYPDLRTVGGRFEGGLVHRLDTATSGVIAAARSMYDWNAARRQFRSGSVGKLYVALVTGTIRRSASIAAAIGAERGRPMQRAYPRGRQPKRGRAQPASTRFRPLAVFHNTTLLAVRITTGVRHQIRVHLASLGHPIVGDTLYGDESAGRAERLMLHAIRLRLRHPRTGAPIMTTSPIPPEFAAVIARAATAGGRDRD
jgi:23S rRNA pseudouridine1911/1915/1917 synthase